MSFIAGYLLGLGQGGNKVIQPLSVTKNGPYNAADYGADGFDPVLVNVPSAPVSLEGFNSLKNMATVKIGTYVFEIKEPTLLYSGKVNVDTTKSYDAGVWECGWHSAIVLNRTIAAAGTNRVAVEYRAWGEFTDNDGKTHSEYYNTYSDFAVTSVNIHAQNNYLPATTIGWSYTVTSGYSDDSPYIERSTASIYSNSFYEMNYPVITNLSYEEYFQYVKKYLETTSGAEPIVTIL